MSQKGADFLKKLLATFKMEAGEHVQAMSSGLLDLEKASSAEKEMETLETVFREAHSLKGAARAVNVVEMESLCQSLESIFSSWKRREVATSPALFDLLHKAVDTLGKLLLSMEAEPPAARTTGIAELLRALENARTGKLSPLQPEERKRMEAEAPVLPQPEAYRSTVEAKPLAVEKILSDKTIIVNEELGT